MGSQVSKGAEGTGRAAKSCSCGPHVYQGSAGLGWELRVGQLGRAAARRSGMGFRQRLSFSAHLTAAASSLASAAESLVLWTAK